jgi:hypothetical protein
MPALGWYDLLYGKAPRLKNSTHCEPNTTPVIHCLPANGLGHAQGAGKVDA